MSNKIKVKIEGPAGAGKTAVATMLQDALLRAGVAVEYDNEELAENRLVRCSMRLEGMRRSRVSVHIEEVTSAPQVDEGLVDEVKRAYASATQKARLLKTLLPEEATIFFTVIAKDESQAEIITERVQQDIGGALLEVLSASQASSRVLRGRTRTGVLVLPGVELGLMQKSTLDKSMTTARSMLTPGIETLSTRDLEDRAEKSVKAKKVLKPLYDDDDLED